MFHAFLLVLQGGEGCHSGLNVKCTEEEKSFDKGSYFLLIYSPYGSALLARAAAVRGGAAWLKAQLVSLGNRGERSPRALRAEREAASQEFGREQNPLERKRDELIVS